MKIGGGSRCLQPVPWDMQPSGGKPVSMDKPVAEPGSYNPSTLEWLIGHANEATVVVEGGEMMALEHTGSQLSTITEGFCSEFGLCILPLGGGCCILRGQGVLWYHTRDTQRLTSFYQVYPCIMRMCYSWLFQTTVWGEGTCANRYPGYRSVGCNCDHGRIAAGLGIPGNRYT